MLTMLSAPRCFRQRNPTRVGKRREVPCFNALVTGEPGAGWFAVRCVFRKGWPPPADYAYAGNGYEERITLWRAANMDEAIEKAEREALSYAGAIDDAPDEYLGLAQGYALFDSPDHDGAEVFSLIRDSVLEPNAYLDTFFDTGHEHQERIRQSG